LFRQISIEVDKTRDYKSYQMYSPFFHHYRMILQRKNELKFIDFKSDTIYLQEIFITESSPLMAGTIWNRNGHINYSFMGDERYPDDMMIFVDSSLAKYVSESKGDVEEYYKKLPQHGVKDRYYFEKIVIEKGMYRIISRTAFDY
jgi:hypothetical protein